MSSNGGASSQKTAKLDDSVTVPSAGLELRSVLLPHPAVILLPENGIGRGLFTGFDQFDNGICEYVFPVVETETGFKVDYRQNPPCGPFGLGNF